MIKDPYHKEETPYDVLNLEPYATHKEVQGALATFMRDLRNRSRLPKAQEASKKLKNSKTRIEVDILYYCIGKIDTDMKEMDLDSILNEFSSVRELRNKDQYSDLNKENFNDDYIEIQERKIKLSEIKKYDDVESYEMEHSLLSYDL
ncbi:MAG: hypothetical protein ACE5H1_10480 [Thermodesulfobacteriota bacterium]